MTGWKKHEEWGKGAEDIRNGVSPLISDGKSFHTQHFDFRDTLACQITEYSCYVISGIRGKEPSP